MRVAVLTQIPSPYQVELFDAVAARGALELAALYLDPVTTGGRQWRMPTLAHEGVALDSVAAEAQAQGLLDAADLVVFSDYNDPRSARWMARRAASGQAWCFWGERPGVRVRGWAGRLLRRFRMRRLHASRAAIWGIGEWAVQGYREEFGGARDYVDLPYFSNLDRFAAAAAAAKRSDTPLRILYSGSLTERKGVDLLAAAFQEAARQRPEIELTLLGSGPMRAALERKFALAGVRARFLGFRDWRDLPQSYADADLLCVPSRYDGWGLVVPEGLAAGLPVIGTDRMGAALELIRPGENGWRVAAGELRPLRNALLEAVSLTPAAHAAMRAAASRGVARHGLQDGARRFEEAALKTHAGWRG